MKQHNDPIIRWDNYFMSLADVNASMSKDPSTQVGAVIVEGRNVIGMGYNGFPPGVDDDPRRYRKRETKYKFVTHAELNAILTMREPKGTDPLTLYATLSPCNECAKSIITAGISEVVYSTLRNNETTNTMFREAGVKMRSLYT